MKKTISEDPYRIINLVFIFIIAGIIAYSIYYGSPGREHPIPSASQILTGKSGISTGLSRSFSAIVRLQFDRALSFNPYGIRIFLFFLIQLFMRIFGFFMVNRLDRKVVVRFDILVTIGVFTVIFWPFLKELFSELFR